MNNSEGVQMRSLNQWTFNIDNVLLLVKTLLDHFRDIYISDFSDKTFKLKIKKNVDNNISIGFLYGLIVDQVNKLLII
jgi:hypothetical protein